jgi:hypothetical protein
MENKKHNLRSFEDLVKDLSDKYGVPFEKVESIIRDFLRELYYTATNRNVKD